MYKIQSKRLFLIAMFPKYYLDCIGVKLSKAGMNGLDWIHYNKSGQAALSWSSTKQQIARLQVN